MTKIRLIDNYDSFTYNLVHYMMELGAEVEVTRNNQISVDAALTGVDGLVISPGPATPDDSGICLELVKAAADKATIPILGVCLGHQAIGQAFGGKVIRSNNPMHGKTSDIHHQGTDVFHGLPSPCSFTRYHSLILDAASLPDCFEITAKTDDETIMGIAHRTLPLYGVQFHPESIASTHGHHLLKNYLQLI